MNWRGGGDAAGSCLRSLSIKLLHLLEDMDMIVADVTVSLGLCAAFPEPAAVVLLSCAYDFHLLAALCSLVPSAVTIPFVELFFREIKLFY